MINSYIFFLGSNSTLSAIELMTTLIRRGYAPQIELAEAEFIWLNTAATLPGDFLQTLGGIDRIARLRARQKQIWSAEELVEALSPTADKFSLGISTLNIDGNYDARKIGFEVKKLLRRKGVKAKFILPKLKGGQLNAAQIIFNKLTAEPNKEITIIAGKGKEYLLAETKQIQDIQAYEERDTGRPVRDARVGMLPPKLAQIMLNLVPNFSVDPPVILDPFCGLGTIVQEGYLMGYEMLGCDVSERMVEASSRNLASRVLSRRFLPARSPATSIFKHDVREAFPDDLVNKFDAVVTEPDLGEPLTTPLPQVELKQRMQESAELYLDFFRNIRLVLKDDAWIVFALPAFASKATYSCLPGSFLDEVRKLGYSLNQLLPDELKQYYEASGRGTVIYARPDALVGRELTLWHTRKREDQHN